MSMRTANEGRPRFELKKNPQLLGRIGRPQRRKTLVFPLSSRFFLAKASARILSEQVWQILQTSAAWPISGWLYCFWLGRQRLRLRLSPGAAAPPRLFHLS
jgi:hypothetical protein